MRLFWIYGFRRDKIIYFKKEIACLFLQSKKANWLWLVRKAMKYTLYLVGGYLGKIAKRKCLIGLKCLLD